MSESQISAMMATVHSSINGDEVNKKKKKESACNAGDADLTPESGRFPGEGNGYPLQYSCLENSMDRGAWQATVHGGHKELDPAEQLSFTHSLTHSPRFVCCCLLVYSFNDLDGLFWYFPPLCEASDMLLRGCSPGYMHNNSRMAVVAELSETVCFPELSVKLAASAGIIPNF